MRRLIIGLLALAVVATANVIKYENIAPRDIHFTSHHVQARSLQDFDFIKQRLHALSHNIVKRSPGWKSKGSKSKGSSSGFFSSKAKGNQNSGHHNQPSSYGHAASAPNYAHPPPGGHQPAYNPGYHAGYPAGYPAAGHAHMPTYHPPFPPAAPPQKTVVVIKDRSGGGGGGGGGYSGGFAQPARAPGIGTAIATGLAQGAGTGVGFGLANAAVNSFTGNGGSRHAEQPYYPPPPNNNNNGNSGTGTNNNNNFNPMTSEPNFNAQANPDCLRSCFSTEEYAPVCGTDGWEYTNMGKLNCMKTCGKRVEIARYGGCNAPPPPGYAAPAIAPALPAAPPVSVPVAPGTPVAPPNSPVVGAPASISADGPQWGTQSNLTDGSVSSGTPVVGALPPGVEAPSGVDASTPVQSTTTVSPEYAACLDRCDATSEYNPQCGVDGQEYSNPGRVKCAKDCGKAVEIAYAGPCAKTTGGQPTTTPAPSS